jgi:hypothetical protein
LGGVKADAGTLQPNKTVCVPLGTPSAPERRTGLPRKMGASVKNKRFPGLPAPDVEALYKKVTKTAKETPNDFIVGRMLNELKEMDKFYFEQCIKNLPLGRRKAYYLQSVYSKYASLHIDVGELHEIGWTKLPVMAKTVNRDNVKLYLDMANDSNTRQLRAKLA